MKVVTGSGDPTRLAVVYCVVCLCGFFFFFFGLFGDVFFFVCVFFISLMMCSFLFAFSFFVCVGPFGPPYMCNRL